MPNQRSATRRRPARSVTKAIAFTGVMLVLALDVDEAFAQRPFAVYDPFYRSETARRVFFDGYSVTTDISCCNVVDSLQRGGLPSNAGIFGLPLGLGFQLNYQLGQQLDISAVIDAAGSYTGRNLSLSWLALKYYWTVDHVDYAFRIAVDPSVDGQVGFPQLDLAFLSTTILTPLISSDLALGARRIRMGYQQWVSDEGARDIVFTRALGYEVHIMINYNLHLDPGGSNVFLTFLGEGGNYTLVESSQRQTQEQRLSKSGDHVEEAGATWQSDYRGGVFWVRSGVTYSRPSYMVAPFVSLPVAQWQPAHDERSAAALHAGVRLMLR